MILLFYVTKFFTVLPLQRYIVLRPAIGTQLVKTEVKSNFFLRLNKNRERILRGFANLHSLAMFHFIS